MLRLPRTLIDSMQLRAGSNFRPGEEDVEIEYSLSGSDPNIADRLHSLSSGEVIGRASPDSIYPYPERIVEHVKKERGGNPKLLVNIHTHPKMAPELSEQDKGFHREAWTRIKELLPEVNLIFGVHALTEEGKREETSPVKSAGNKIKWSSIIRGHEVGFFTPDGKPYQVELQAA